MEDSGYQPPMAASALSDDSSPAAGGSNLTPPILALRKDNARLCVFRNVAEFVQHDRDHDGPAFQLDDWGFFDSDGRTLAPVGGGASSGLEATGPSVSTEQLETGMKQALRTAKSRIVASLGSLGIPTSEQDEIFAELDSLERLRFPALLRSVIDLSDGPHSHISILPEPASAAAAPSPGQVSAASVVPMAAVVSGDDLDAPVFEPERGLVDPGGLIHSAGFWHNWLSH